MDVLQKYWFESTWLEDERPLAAGMSTASFNVESLHTSMTAEGKSGYPIGEFALPSFIFYRALE